MKIFFDYYLKFFIGMGGVSLDDTELQYIADKIYSFRSAGMSGLVLPDGMLSKLTKKEAYDVQKKVVARLEKEIVGWKLGGTNHSSQSAFHTSELYFGPVFSGDLLFSKGGVTEIPSGVLCGEVEIALQLSKTIDESNYREFIALPLNAFVSNSAISVEFPWSVFQDLPELGLSALICDCCAEGKALIGECYSFSQSDFSDVDGIQYCGPITSDVLNTKRLANPIDKIIKDFMTTFFSLYGKELKQGQWVFTGGVTKCLEVEAGISYKVVTADLGGRNLVFTIL